MDESRLTTLVSQTSQLMEKFERRFAAMDEQMAQTRHAMTEITKTLPAIVQRSADDSLRSMPAHVMTQIRGGLDLPMGEYETRLNHASKQLSDASRTLADQISDARKLHRALLWKVAGVTGTSLVSLIIGAVWLATHYAGVIRNNQISGDLLRVYNRADVMLCNDGLCANIDLKGGKFGEHGEYRPVRKR